MNLSRSSFLLRCFFKIVSCIILIPLRLNDRRKLGLSRIYCPSSWSDCSSRCWKRERTGLASWSCACGTTLLHFLILVILCDVVLFDSCLELRDLMHMDCWTLDLFDCIANSLSSSSGTERRNCNCNMSRNTATKRELNMIEMREMTHHDRPDEKNTKKKMN